MCLASKKHHIAPKKRSGSLIASKIFWESKPPDTSCCMVCLNIPNLMVAALLLVVLETEMFTLNFFLQAETFLWPNFTARTTNIQTLGLNLTNLKHTTIKNKQCIKDLITDNGGQTGWQVYFTHRHLCLYALTIQRDILPKRLRQTIDKCEFKHKSFELISGPVLSSLWRSEEENGGGGGGSCSAVCHNRHKV